MSSEIDHPRQRTVAELLAEHGDAGATGRRRRRREAELGAFDAVDNAGPVNGRAAPAEVPVWTPDRSRLREPVPPEDSSGVWNPVAGSALDARGLDDGILDIGAGPMAGSAGDHGRTTEPEFGHPAAEDQPAPDARGFEPDIGRGLDDPDSARDAARDTGHGVRAGDGGANGWTGYSSPAPNVAAPNVAAPNVAAPNVAAPNVAAPSAEAPDADGRGAEGRVAELGGAGGRAAEGGGANGRGVNGWSADRWPADGAGVDRRNGDGATADRWNGAAADRRNGDGGGTPRNGKGMGADRGTAGRGAAYRRDSATGSFQLDGARAPEARAGAPAAPRLGVVPRDAPPSRAAAVAAPMAPPAPMAPMAPKAGTTRTAEPPTEQLSQVRGDRTAVLEPSRRRTSSDPGRRGRLDDAGPPTQASSPFDLDDDRPAGLGPAGLRRAAARDVDDLHDDERRVADTGPRERAAAPVSSGQAWAGVVAQWILGAVGGAALWVGFRFLWQELTVVAIAAAVVVTVGLVLIVRHLLRNDDRRTTVFAVLVGLLLTVSPGLLVLLHR